MEKESNSHSLVKKRKLGIIMVVICVFVALIASAACAPTQRELVPGGSGSENGGENDAPVVSVEWTPNSNCAGCHTTESSNMGTTGCVADASDNEQCLTCHTEDETSLTTIHADTSGAMPLKLTTTKVTDETCLGCHYETVDALIAATNGVSVVTDNDDVEQNPHNPNDGNPLNDGNAHDVVPCARCHNTHKSTDLQKNARAVCLGCHHEGTWECNACHTLD